MFGIIGKAIDMATSPLLTAADILDGLTEGEIRTKAVARFGSQALVGLDIVEIAELLADD